MADREFLEFWRPYNCRPILLPNTKIYFGDICFAGDCPIFLFVMTIIVLLFIPILCLINFFHVRNTLFDHQGQLLCQRIKLLFTADLFVMRDWLVLQKKQAKYVLLPRLSEQRDCIFYTKR